jgi:cytochrome c peroxidase
MQAFTKCPMPTPRVFGATVPTGCVALILSTISVLGWGAADTPASPEGERWWSANSGREFPAILSYADESGIITTLNLKGPTDTHNHPFFSPLGTNGRACITCHQPADGMSVSAHDIQARWQATNGKDPIFAAIDGSNCPSLPQDERASHSLLLERGTFRVARPWPPVDANGKKTAPQFDIEVVRDPTGCNTSAVYGLHGKNPTVSVFRRPRPATNLKYLTAVGFVFEPKNGFPLPIDPESGQRMSGNLLADSRAGTLKLQLLDAMRTHLETEGNLGAEQIQRILDFEAQLYTAQSVDFVGGKLDDGGAHGGPETLALAKPGVLKSSKDIQWVEYSPWAASTTTSPASASTNPATTNAPGSDAQRLFRESVARGAAIFRERTFLISDSSGLNSMNFGNPTRDSCNFCHNMTRTGMDVAPGQVDLGTTNEPFADPAPDLPLFKLTCHAGETPHPFLGAVVYTHDPGFALSTGRCVDIGKITMQSMRGLAARAPYFSNGSARTLRDIVEFYNRRYNIGYTEQEKQDLTNLMSVL